MGPIAEFAISRRAFVARLGVEEFDLGLVLSGVARRQRRRVVLTAKVRIQEREHVRGHELVTGGVRGGVETGVASTAR